MNEASMAPHQTEAQSKTGILDRLQDIWRNEINKPKTLEAAMRNFERQYGADTLRDTDLQITNYIQQKGALLDDPLKFSNPAAARRWIEVLLTFSDPGTLDSQIVSHNPHFKGEKTSYRTALERMKSQIH